MMLRDTDSFLVKSISDFNTISDKIVNKNLMVVVLGMLEDEDMEKECWSYFHPAYVISDDWVTVFVRNKSHGFMSDLLESAAGKFLGRTTESLFKTSLEHPARILEYIISKRQNKTKKTVIVCHSQGGIITVNALNSSSKSDCENIQVAFMGAANWTLPKHLDKSDCVCISTKLDYVCIPLGRYFLPSTVKLANFTTHSISKYAWAIYSISRQLENKSFVKFNRDEF